jgi:hypothetical protein
VKAIFGEDEAKQVMQNRFQLINIWRPLGLNPITYKPLTICDYSSLDLQNDVHPLEVHGSPNTSSAYTVSCKTPDSQRWYYLSEMRSDEMFLMKMFDTKLDVAQFGFHVAFTNDSMYRHRLSRKKVLRCVALFYMINKKNRSHSIDTCSSSKFGRKSADSVPHATLI